MTDGQFSSDNNQSGDWGSKHSVGSDVNNASYANTNTNPTEPINTQSAQSTQQTEQMPQVHTAQHASTQQQSFGTTQNFGAQQTPYTASANSAYNASYGAHSTTTNSFTGAASSNATEAPSASSATVIPAGASTANTKKSSAGKTFIVAFAGALIACVLAFGVASATGLFGTSVTLGSSSSSVISSTDDEDTSLATQVANKCLPSVVSINVYTDSTSTSSSSSSIYDFLYGDSSNSSSTTYTLSSRGSGVILSSDGYILTNYHVVANGKMFEAVVDGNTLEATLVGTDSSSDVAVLKVEGSGYTAIEIGDSDNIEVGEWVMTIGSPFGLEQSVATGIISATSRSQIIDQSSLSSSGIDTSLIYPSLIQTDAAINPGNSGGALVNAEGQLIGINTLITSYSGNYSGVGFSIPSNYAINLAQEIIEGKTPTHAQLGVTLSTVSAEAAARYGFKVTSGAYISSIVSGSGAENAGLQVGDIVVGFDGKTVSSASDLLLDIRTKNPGDKVTLTINRNGVEMQVEVTLGSDEDTTSASSSSNSNSNSNSQSQQYGYSYNRSQTYSDNTSSSSTDAQAA
jgi:putative serine protease PepD